MSKLFVTGVCVCVRACVCDSWPTAGSSEAAFGGERHCVEKENSLSQRPGVETRDYPEPSEELC